MKKPETIFKERVLRDLRTLENVWVKKIQSVSVRGIPDLLACINGVFVAIELKVDSPLEPLQDYELSRIEKANGLAMVASPSTWSKQFQKLTALARKPCVHV